MVMAQCFGSLIFLKLGGCFLQLTFRKSRIFQNLMFNFALLVVAVSFIKYSMKMHCIAADNPVFPSIHFCHLASCLFKTVGNRAVGVRWCNLAKLDFRGAGEVASQIFLPASPIFLMKNKGPIINIIMLNTPKSWRKYLSTNISEHTKSILDVWKV